jgi:hypothetical protein
MTPKEKAEELILKYLRIDNNTSEWFNTHIAKQCALIAVDEIISTFAIMGLGSKFYEDVKTEIEKL